MRHRARVCKGILADKSRRACRAASFAELSASLGSGDGKGGRSAWRSSLVRSSSTISVDCHLLLGAVDRVVGRVVRLVADKCEYWHVLAEAVDIIFVLVGVEQDWDRVPASNWPGSLCNRILFMIYLSLSLLGALFLSQASYCPARRVVMCRRWKSVFNVTRFSTSRTR